jgi:hypothetical protein
MLDKERWKFAVAHFAGFVSHLPGSPTEDHVAHYHGIIKLFEEACGGDLSQFKIASDQLKPRKASHPAWQTRHPQKRIVEFAYFCGRVRSLVDYLKASQASHSC